MSATGQFEVIASWADQLRKRPFDRPMYTALHGTPTILVYLSADAVDDSGVLARIFAERRPWALSIMAFVKGPFPILRCVLTLPDNPRDPYLMESPLDVREGDVQAFCGAAFTNEKVDLIVAHERLAVDEHAAVSFNAPGLSAALRKEIGVVVSKLKPGTSPRDVDAAVQAMEQAYSSASDGLQAAQRVPLTFAGEATNRLIRASF